MRRIGVEPKAWRVLSEQENNLSDGLISANGE